MLEENTPTPHERDFLHQNIITQSPAREEAFDVILGFASESVLIVDLRVCRAVDEALRRGSPAVIDSDLRKALLSGCEALSLHHRLVQSLSLCQK